MMYPIKAVTAVILFLSTALMAQTPNVIFILVDDLGYMDIVANGSDFYETPNVDQLAADGMRFTNGYAASPICSPTRASILQGKNPGRTNMTQFFGGSAGAAGSYRTLDKEDILVQEALKGDGYATAFFGKWHLNRGADDGVDFWPQSHGFDLNWGGHFRGGPYIPNQYHAPYVDGDGNLLPNFEQGPDGEYLTDRLAMEVNEFIEAEKDGPFFAYLSFYSVHAPFDAPQDRIAPYNQKRDDLGLTSNEREDPNDLGGGGDNVIRVRQDHPTYAAMVESVDMAVGSIVARLEELGLTENTIIFFTSDHGGLSTSEGRPTSNEPYKAGKGWLYEGGLKVPLIVKWPGVTDPGSVSDGFVLSTDYYPTILEMAGLDLLPDEHEDGVSFVGLLNGSRVETRSTMFFHYPHNSNQGGRPSSAVRVRDHKLINHYENNNNRLELYNVVEDIGEDDNLANDMPGLRDSLLGILQKWWTDVDANHDPAYDPIPGITQRDPPAVDETVVAVRPRGLQRLAINHAGFTDSRTLEVRLANPIKGPVKVSLHDVKGKSMVAQKDLNMNGNYYSMKLSNTRANGLYFLKVQFQNQFVGTKISTIYR